MTIDRLREALTALGPPPDARELSEMLWLACHISPAEEQARPSLPALPDPPDEPPDPPPPVTAPAPAPAPPPQPLTRLHPRPAPGAEPAGAASEVLVPTAPMLADPLGVQRALRPLKRRVPSRHRFELDEDATAARVADTRLWTPVLVPSPERWLSLSLIVDTGPTMRLWRPLARELTEALRRQGAFQDVHTAYLDTTGRITSAPGAPPQDPGTLLDASGRHAVLVLSDCSGPHWWDGRAARAVRRWARTGPAAILQPLAERLWRRTAAPAAPGLAFLPRPAAPNTDLRFTPYDGPHGPGVPVPVLEAAPRWFGAWARLVSGSGPQPAAVATFPSRPSGAAPLHRERDLPVDERVRRFLATASPDAAELAAHVAVSVPSLPVMRLIQHRILGGSGPGQLAEVLLSGLLRPLGGVRYEFVPGARDALLDTLPRPEALHTRRVLEAVSAEIERRAGTAADRFRALLPTDGGPVTLTADTDHFALLTPQTRTHLAPGPPPAAPDLLDILGTPDDLLGDDWNRRPPHPTAIGVDDTGETVWIDVLRGGPQSPTGMVLGPPGAAHEMLRTILLSLALNHSPDRVSFALLDCSDFQGSEPHRGLELLPHYAPPFALWEEEQRRRLVFAEENVHTWDDYQDADARGDRRAALPILVLVVGLPHPAETDHPIGHFARFVHERDLGIRFVFYATDDTENEELDFLDLFLQWHITLADSGDGYAELKNRGQEAVRFRPAQMASTVAGPLLARMSQRGPHAPERHDVLKLNGEGRGRTFDETWALDPSTPRKPAVGYDEDGNVVSLYSLDLSSGIPHGLIAGDTGARQRVVRAITLALAFGYAPSDLNLAFAGLGEHPAGEAFDLPHVLFSEAELLGRPGRLQQFLEYLSDELDARAAATASSEAPPRLLVVADLSLTFPSSRRDVAERLLSVAQRGRALGVQLLLSSNTVEGTTIWNRFLPLLGWRIAASGLPPAELRRVLGRATLPFPDERSAYLVAGGGAPRGFTVAHEPSREHIDDFVRRANARPSSAYREILSADLQAMVDDLDVTVRAPDVRATLRELILGDVEFLNTGRRPRHLVLTDISGLDIEALAEEYARILAELGVLSHRGVSKASWVGQTLRQPLNPSESLTNLFRFFRGGVLLVQGVDERNPERRYFTPEVIQALIEAMDEEPDDPLVILYGYEANARAVSAAVPEFAERFRWMTAGQPPPGPRVRLGSDPQTHEPVFLDFASDRHLLISGPSGSGTGTLMGRLIDELVSRRDHGTGTLVYVLDGRGSLADLARVRGWEQAGVRYAAAPENFERLLENAIGATQKRLRRGNGSEVFLFVAGRRRFLMDDPLMPVLPQLVALRDRGLHLVVSRQLVSFGEAPDPMIAAMREFGAPVLLLGEAGGHEVDAWDVPSSLRGPLPRNHALLAHPDRRRLIRVAQP